MLVCGKPPRFKSKTAELDGAKQDRLNSSKDSNNNINSRYTEHKESLETQLHNAPLAVEKTNEENIAQELNAVERNKLENKTNKHMNERKKEKAKHQENAIAREDTEFLSREKHGQSLSRKDKNLKIQEDLGSILSDNVIPLASKSVSKHRSSAIDVTSKASTNHEGDTKTPSSSSSNEKAPGITAFSTTSTNQNSSTMLTYDAPSLSTNQISDTVTNDESTNQVLPVVNKDSSRVGSDKMQQDTGARGMDSMSSSLSVSKTDISTNQITPSTLASENPFIALTNGSPGRPTNRFFRGMEWSKSDVCSSRNKKIKDVEHDTKNTGNSRKDLNNSSSLATTEESKHSQTSRDIIRTRDHQTNSTAITCKSQTPAQLLSKDGKPVPKPRDKAKNKEAHDQVDGMCDVE